MTNKLHQKHILWGSQTFEIIDDTVIVTTKARFRAQEKLTVMLTVLNSEPLINKSRLEFTSRVNNEALLSLFLAKPNADEFNNFVSTLKQHISDEFNAFAGIKTNSNAALQRNVFEEPPEFDDDGEAFEIPGFPTGKSVRVEDLEDAIRMIEQYVGGEQIQPLISALKELAQAPESYDKLAKVSEEFNATGAAQGAILTYAPYVGILMTDSQIRSY